MPYLTPDEIPTDTICRVLKIPNDRAIIAAVTGALNELIYSWNWEQGGTVTPQEASQALVNMFDQFCFNEGSCRMIGEIVLFAGDTSPSEGWLLCDGASLERTTYADLFAVIGTLYGAADGSHFNIPNLSGRASIGTGPGWALSETGGEQEHTLTIDEIPSHDHSIDGTLPGLALAPGEEPVLVPSPFPSVTGLTGNDNPHNNMQPYIVLNYFIVATDE